MAGKPKKEHNPEAVELINRLKERIGCKTDAELGRRLNIDPTIIARWKRRGLTDITKGFISIILEL